MTCACFSVGSIVLEVLWPLGWLVRLSKDCLTKVAWVNLTGLLLEVNCFSYARMLVAHVL